MQYLDEAVNVLRNRGVEVIETDAGGTFRRAETETIDYVAQAEQSYTNNKSHNVMLLQKTSMANNQTSIVIDYKHRIQSTVPMQKLIV